jgi:O-antigen ligase
MQWRGPVGLGLLLLFALTILASGSRAGMAIGTAAIMIAGIIARRGLRRELRHTPRWVLPVVLAAIIALLGASVLASVAADRAVSIQRSLSIDVEQDMRNRAFPTVWEMTRDAFPAGSGLGGFDPLFRIHESLDLLKPTYFNQAHNDFIEVVLGAGLPGLLLLIAALAWWAWASVRAWRNLANRQSMLPQLGSAVILLVIAASVFDYPARTPLIMAVIVIATVWLSGPSEENVVSALPGSGQHL